MWNLLGDYYVLETPWSPNMTFRKEEGGRDLYFSSFLSAEPVSSFILGLWCWYICKYTNLTVRASCCFLLSLCPEVWLCTLILQGHKPLRITLNYFSHFLLVTSVSKFHTFFESMFHTFFWTRLFSEPTSHAYLTIWSHHCSDNRKCIFWTWIKHISGAHDGL